MGDSAGGEILTLQVGTHSNYVGAQFWNMQDEVLGSGEEDEDGGELRTELLYRVTEQSCVPRTVVVEYKQMARTLQPLRQVDSGFSTDQIESHWSGKVDVHQEEQLEQSDFMKWLQQGSTAVESVALGYNSNNSVTGFMDENHVEQSDEDEDDLYMKRRVKEKQVKTWSDFMKAQLHHKSINLLHRYGDMDQSTFTSGAALAREGSKEMEEIVESIRYFLEECDRLQGVHLMVDVNSGFGSIAEGLLSEIKEDIRKATVVTFGVGEPETIAEADSKYGSYTSCRAMNEAVGMSCFTEHTDMYVPLPLYNLHGLTRNPYLSESFDPQSVFHTASLAAVGVDCLSLPYRRQNPTHGPFSAVSMNEFAAKLAPSESTRLVNLSLGFPFPFPCVKAAELEQLLANWEPLSAVKNPLGINLSCVRMQPPTNGQPVFPMLTSYSVLRGVTLSDSNRTRMSDVENILEAYTTRMSLRMSPVPLFSALKTPMPITLGFPDVLKNHLFGPQGELAIGGGERRRAPPVSVPVFAHVENSARSGADVLHAYNTVSNASMVTKFDFSKGPAGFDAEDFLVIRERLSHMKENYSHAEDYA